MKLSFSPALGSIGLQVSRSKQHRCVPYKSNETNIAKTRMLCIYSNFAFTRRESLCSLDAAAGFLVLFLAIFCIFPF